MKTLTPIVNALDKQRLTPHIRPELAPTWPILRLRQMMDTARIVPPEKVPSNVVTMNSRVRVHDLQWDVDETLTLVYPNGPEGMEAGAAENADGSTPLTVISPLGSALLGTRVGQSATWIGPRGPRRIRVDALEFQPEAAGRFDL